MRNKIYVAFAFINLVIYPCKGMICKYSTNPQKVYESMLGEYNNGKREGSFLMNLATVANQCGDTHGAKILADDYISQVKPPFTKEGLLVVKQ